MLSKKIGRGQIALGLFKSLFLQASFSYQWRQGKGLGFVLRSPRLREFNTNPYLFPTIFGLWLKEGVEKIENYSQILGAIGDDFFWRRALPFFSLLAILFFLLSPSSLLGVLIFLIPYNCLTFFTRLWGFRLSYNEGEAGVLRMLRFLKTGSRILEPLIPIVIGFLFFFFLLNKNIFLSPVPDLSWLFFTLAFIGSLVLYQLSPIFTAARIFFCLLILLIFLVILR